MDILGASQKIYGGYKRTPSGSEASLSIKLSILEFILIIIIINRSEFILNHGHTVFVFTKSSAKSLYNHNCSFLQYVIEWKTAEYTLRDQIKEDHHHVTLAKSWISPSELYIYKP